MPTSDFSTQNVARFWRCGQFSLPLGAKTYVMAILNVTPDSFSGDGLANRVLDDAISRAQNAIANGADILDIGGESTRPGASVVSDDEEMRRVVPLIEAISVRLEIPISVDTTKSSVAKSALAAGACIVNDISGATADAQMWPLLAQKNCGCVLMHRRGNSQTMRASVREKAKFPTSSTRNAETETPDVIAEILDFWRECLEKAHTFGVAHERIAFDAGFGFGKSVSENLEIVRRGRELSDFGFPTLSGTSRKSTILRVLESEDQNLAAQIGDTQNIEERAQENRLWGTAATVALAIAGGAEIVRVHDVREMAKIARMTDAIVRNPSKNRA